MSRQNIIPTAEPFFFPGDSTGCLLVHGFTGSPKEMRTMGEFLAAQGHTVLGIRLAGHATNPDDMRRCHWEDWLNSVEDGLHLLSICKTRFIMGLSMGGILSLLAASRFPVTGVVAMSTLYQLQNDWRMNFIGVLKYILPEVAKGASDWKDHTFENEHVDYPAYPTACIAQLNELTFKMQQALPSIQAPVLLIHSRNDGGVPPVNAERIFDHLGSQDKELLWVENSGHIITRDGERQRVFQAAEEFIQKVSAQLEK